MRLAMRIGTICAAMRSQGFAVPRTRSISRLELAPEALAHEAEARKPLPRNEPLPSRHEQEADGEHAPDDRDLLQVPADRDAELLHLARRARRS